LDRNRVRRATLVPGFPVSWAVEGLLGAIEGRWRAGWAGRPCCARGLVTQGIRAGGGSRASGVCGPGARQRKGCPRRPTVASRRGQRPFGDGLSIAANRATRLQPNVARVATGLVQSTHSSVQQPHGDGRFGGPTGESPTEGSGLSRGGNTVGGQGAAKWCVGLLRPSDGDSPGGPTTRAGAPFAPLSGPGRSLEWPWPRGSVSATLATSARFVVAP
jgi:hypothetical protein